MHESHLDGGRDPFPILERTIHLDLEHPEDVNERTTPVSDYVANRTIIRHEFRDPLPGFNLLLDEIEVVTKARIENPREV